MEISTGIGLIGTVASIIGAVISIVQASKAAKAATEAEKAKQHLIHHRQSNEVVIIQEACRNTLTSIGKFGPAAVIANLQGASVSREAKDVQDFLQLLTEHRANFQTDTTNEADKLCNAVNQFLTSFAQAHSTEEKIRYGKNIYLLLNPFLSILKNMTDQNRENI